MTAHLDIAWATPSQSTILLTSRASGAHAALTRQLGGRGQPARCPECHSVVYSRRHKLCGVCNQPLPPNLLFSPQESHHIEALLWNERTKHRQWLQQRAF